jgi:thermostable 8-oxoguanine DNA glycosylase
MGRDISFFMEPLRADSASLERLSRIMKEHHSSVKDKMPMEGAWRSMDSDSLWMVMVRIMCAVGRSDPSYDLVRSEDAELLRIGEMKKYQEKFGRRSLVIRTHGLLAAHHVRYCSPKKNTSMKARAIVMDLNDPVIVEGLDFVLLKNAISSGADPREFMIKNVYMFGPKVSSEFLMEVGFSPDYMAFDSRLRRIFLAALGFDIGPYLRTASGYFTLEKFFRETVCPAMGMTPLEVDTIAFWRYREILRELDGELYI